MQPDAARAGAARLAPDTALKAALWYLVLTIGATWPLATALASAVPSDLGDPLLNDWILAWNARHLLDALEGNVGALGALWHANIFHPTRYALGYSELLITQSLLVLPVYALTGNIVLGYNLLFITAFVLSGLGMYLFARSVANDWRVGSVAGVLFAFAPYRFHQAPHLQVIWSCWMPLVLYGLRRWFDLTDASTYSRARAWRVLAWTAVALAAQNLSCGYYMIFFAPFVALYAAWEMVWRRRLGSLRTWAALAATAVGAAAMTVPFMAPYFALRRLGQQPRGLAEVASFSADSFAYLTAHGGLRVWGWLQTFPRAEGSLFPGAVPVVLALTGLVAAVVACGGRWTPSPADRHADTQPASQTASRWRRAGATLAGVVAAGHGLAFVGLFFGLEGKHDIGPLEIRMFSVARPLIVALVASGVLLALSPRARAAARCLVRQPAAFASVATFLAFWLSLGPAPRVLGDTLRDASIYGWLYAYVPGLSGLRVPARFAMIATLFLSMTAAEGYRALAKRMGAWLLPAVVVLLLIDSAAVPLPINGEAIGAGHLNPPTVVPTSPTALTRAIDALPRDAVLIELPFGDASWEIRYLYHSIFHWRRMVNGYSGDVPVQYVRQRDALYLLPEEGGDRAWDVLRRSGATHIIVHERAFGPARTTALRAWIEAHGCRPIAHVEETWIYALPLRG